MQLKMVFKICEGISHSLFSVKELDVIVHKKYFPGITLLDFGHSVPHITNELVVEVGTRHSHQILFSKDQHRRTSFTDV